MTACELDWPLAALQAQLAVRWPRARADAVASIGSTNSALMQGAHQGETTAQLLIAEAQSAGRGRAGHGWQTAPGAGALLFSLGVPLAPARWDGLSLALGVALAEALAPEARIKWPNDLWWRQRKLAGILIETAGLPAGQPGRYAVMGVGINLAPPPAGRYATPPAWLREFDPAATAPALLQRLLPSLIAALTRFEADGFAAFHTRFDARDALRGRSVRLPDGTPGVACGVAADGALQVRAEGQLQRISSARIGVRPLVANENAQP